MIIYNKEGAAAQPLLLHKWILERGTAAAFFLSTISGVRKTKRQPNIVFTGKMFVYSTKIREENSGNLGVLMKCQKTFDIQWWTVHNVKVHYCLKRMCFGTFLAVPPNSFPCKQGKDNSCEAIT